MTSGGTVNGTVLYGAAAGDYTYEPTLIQQYISTGATANDTIISVGIQNISSGGIANRTVLKGGATSAAVQYISAGAVTNDTIISGGMQNIYSGGNLNGDVTLYAGGNVTITLSNGGTVDLIENNNSGLTISGYTAGVNTSVSTEIKGFSGLGTNLSDKITIDGLLASNLSVVNYPDDNHIALQLLDGTHITLNMTGIKQNGYTLGSDANGNLR